ncbi:MAG: hypothetical protein WA864_21955 [Acetobacteraceae bacterium]|jgi:hypothetical protein
MRIDPPAPGPHVMIDYVARRMGVLRDAMRSMVEMAGPDNMARMIGDRAATALVRRGEATVAGRVRTEWQMLDRAARQTPGTAR